MPRPDPAPDFPVPPSIPGDKRAAQEARRVARRQAMEARRSAMEDRAGAMRGVRVDGLVVTGTSGAKYAITVDDSVDPPQVALTQVVPPPVPPLSAASLDQP